MSWTKRQFVTSAFEELGLASYDYDLQPEQLDAGLRKLDAMMATWNSKLRLSYPLPSSPQLSSLDTDTTVPDSANEAIYLNLALRLAPSYGKTVPMETKQVAYQAYHSLLSLATMPEQAQFNNSIPAGAGYKTPERPYLSPSSDPILVGQDGELILH